MSNTLKFGNGNWATKEGSTLAYNDENNNFKPLPFNFERDSSATVVNKDGLIETVGTGMPRIDYKDDSEGALLLEPQSTNLVTHSSDFSNASWQKQQSGVSSVPTISSNFSISPNGTQNADRVVFNLNGGTTSNDFSQITLSTAAYTGDATNYIYIKSNTNDSYVMSVCSPTGIANQKTITPNWQKFEITSLGASQALTVRVRLRGGVESTSSFADVSMWGAQLEALPYSTSYIPTSGSTVTRYADECNNAGNDQVINSSEGVLYAEIAALADDLTQRFISLSDETSNNRLILGFDNSSNRIISFARVGGALAFNIIGTVSNVQSYNKIAIKWKENDFALWSNGVELGIDTSGASFPSNVLNTLKFSDADGTTEIFNGNVKDVRLYNTALTDQELQALTQ